MHSAVAHRIDARAPFGHTATAGLLLGLLFAAFPHASRGHLPGSDGRPSVHRVGGKPSRHAGASFASKAPRRMLGEVSAGKFLVASRQLNDPNFMQTVVLLLHYDARGAMGLVVNRPTRVELSTILPEVEELKDRTEAVYLGGPVALDGVMLLIRAPEPPEGATNIFDGVHVTGQLSTLREMARQGRKGSAFRAYVGHAGWGPGQLDREVAAGGWHVATADDDTIFDKPALQVWPDLIDRVAGAWARVDRRCR